IGVDLDRRRLIAGRIATDDLDEAPVTRRATVGDDDAIRGLLPLSHPHQADLHGHEEVPLVSLSNAPGAPAPRRGSAPGYPMASDAPSPGLHVAHRELGHLALRRAAHHLLHHLELLQEAVHVLRGDATSPRDPHAP